MSARRITLCGLLLAFVIPLRGETAAPIALTHGESQTIPIFGVTAAWAIDSRIVDVAAQSGQITLFARTAGRTTIMIASVTGERSYDVVVSPRAGMIATSAGPRAEEAAAELRYSSASREIQSSVSAVRVDRDKRVEAEIRTLHQAAEPRGERVRTSIAGASYRIFTKKREWTLFDRDVEHSPLTLDRTPLRGIHYRDEHWRLHAGYTAYATYRSFLIPVERDVVAGGGYAFRTGARSTITPTLFAIRGEGSVASLLYDYEQPERLLVRGELGYSHRFGGAAELSWNGASDRVRASIRYRPEEFAIAGTATARGFFGEGSWTHTYGRASTASTSLSATDVLGMRVISGSADVDHRLTGRTSLTGGASWASYDDRRTVNVPAGLRIDFDRGGITALYRYTRAFDNEGGHGFRVAGRLSLGSLYANAFVDQQRNAPTLDLIFSQRPDLALALAELGIAATSPADVARALREHAILRELGFIEGITLDLAPVRTQLGLELAWLGTSRSRQQLRARLLRNVTETVAARTTTLIGTLSYSRRLTDATDVFGSWTYWRTDTLAGDASVDPFLELGVRQRFDRLPFAGARGTISGVVVRDEDLDGRGDGTGISAEVELDGRRRQRTREDGSFEFDGVARGTHSVVARVERPDSYFTTPSRVDAAPGDRIVFGVASTPARVLGRVVDDAGTGVANVRVLLARGANQHTRETASDGRFTFTTAPGEWELSIVRDSVPAGYSPGTGDRRTVHLDRDEPMSVDVVLPAHRSVRGRTVPNGEVEVQPLGRRVRADGEGRFALRSLAPGPMILSAGGITRTIDVPKGPATLEVDLIPAVAIASAEPTPRTEVHGEREARLGEHVVQIGAFRVQNNAVAAAARARAAGVPVELAQSGVLVLVRTAPLRSREAAVQVASVLMDAGVDAVVLSAH